MKRIYILSLIATLSISSCQNLVDGINENPNEISIDKIDAGLYINTPELSLIDISRGVFSRISGYWTGQLIGINQVPLSHYNYQVTQSSFSFDGYQSVITQTRFIQEQAPNNKFYQGITRIMEAMLFGTYASFYGDIPCSEVCCDIKYPKFDKQEDIFRYTQTLLDEAIDYLEGLNSATYRQDYIFDGNPIKWKETAYSLKARYYIITKDYENAFANALKGISSEQNSMYYYPVNDNLSDNKNKYYIQNTIMQGISTSDLEGNQCFMFDLMDKRKNAKTDETARKAYFTIDPTNINSNKGITAKLEKESIITYAENLLILAESGTRTKDFNTGLKYLNLCREFLNNGGCINTSFINMPFKYEQYEISDFNKGSLLNKNNIEPERALLREIILERYITGFTSFMPFDDARRLRGTNETDIAVEIPLNNTSVSLQPERLLYPESEMKSNVNAPEEPGLYKPTPINKK